MFSPIERAFRAGSSLAWLFSESKSAFRSFILFRMIFELAFDEDEEDGAIKSEVGGEGLVRAGKLEVEMADFISPSLAGLALPKSDGVIRGDAVLLMDGKVT